MRGLPADEMKKVVQNVRDTLLPLPRAAVGAVAEGLAESGRPGPLSF